MQSGSTGFCPFIYQRREESERGGCRRFRCRTQYYHKGGVNMEVKEQQRRDTVMFLLTLLLKFPKVQVLMPFTVSIPLNSSYLGLRTDTKSPCFSSRTALEMYGRSSWPDNCNLSYVSSLPRAILTNSTPVRATFSNHGLKIFL